MHEFNKTFEGTVWEATLGKVTLVLGARDKVGNKVELKKEVKGAVREVLEQIWDGFAEMLSGVAEAVAEAVSVVVDWVMNHLTNLLNGLKSKFKAMQNDIAQVLEDVAEKAANNETKNMGITLLRLMGFVMGGFAAIMTIYYGLALLINSMPVLGTIIGGVGALMFNLVFYTFYPDDFLEYGKGILSVEEALTKPAEEIYELDKNVASVYSFMFTAVLLCFGSVWSANIGGAATKAFALTYAFNLIALFGFIGLLAFEDYSVEQGAVGAAMLAIASYGLYLTTTTGAASLFTPELGLGGFIARLIFFAIFEVMAGILFLSALGYMDYVVTGE